MENEIKLSCRKCQAKFTIEEVSKAKNICPSCKKETSFLSEPIFFGKIPKQKTKQLKEELSEYIQNFHGDS